MNTLFGNNTKMNRAILFIFLLLFSLIILALISQFYAPQMATRVFQAI